MATAEVQAPPAEVKPAVPDYLADPNAVLKDKESQWRYGRAPDYSKTRKFYEESKQSNHVAGSLPELVQNLVKNWEVEASFKPRLSDWRTIDHANYSFAINGGPPQTAEHMLKVGTYNAIIAPNQYYSPATQDFTSSHKTFKRMMPHFAWEVLEVYSGPPQVAFRWRHWGQMKNDYVGFNDKGEKITVKSHGGNIDIQGVTVAKVDDAVRLQSVQTWFDPLEMFRQIAPNGIVNKEIVAKKVETSATDMRAQDVDAAANKDATADAESHHDAQLLASQDQTQTTTQELPQTPRPTPGSRGASHDSSAREHISTPSSTSPKKSIYTSAVNGAEEERMNRHGDSTNSSSDPKSSNDQPLSVKSLAEALPDESQPAAQPSPSADISQPTPTPTADSSPTAEDADPIEPFLSNPSSTVHPHPHDIEHAVHPAPGEAVAAKPDSAEARATYEEMSRVTAAQCPFLMNRE